MDVAPRVLGNSQLLLQNKLSAIDKIGGLWKVKGDQKIGNTITNLINVMKDLSNLASEHGIEGQLYEGDLENLDLSATKKEEWLKRLKFLERELQLHERLTLDHKTAEMLGLFSNRGNSSKDDDNNNEKTLKHVL